MLTYSWGDGNNGGNEATESRPLKVLKDMLRSLNFIITEKENIGDHSRKVMLDSYTKGSFLLLLRKYMKAVQDQRQLCVTQLTADSSVIFMRGNC